MASRRSRVFLRGMRMVQKLLNTDAHNYETHRRKLDYWAGFIPQLKNVNYQPAKVKGVNVEWITPENANAEKVLYYLHGGGYIVGSINTHRRLIARIAQAADVKALALDYRLAPEHPFPAAVEDACAGYEALIEEGYRPEDIVIAGDSAGGGLAIATMVALKEKDTALPGVAVCLSPWLDLEGTGNSNINNQKTEGVINNEALKAWGKLYAGENNTRHPLVSPIYADLSGLPPLFIQVGGGELLLDDSVRLYEKAIALDVEAELDKWDRMFHVWQVYDFILPEAGRAIEDIGKFIKRYV